MALVYLRNEFLREDITVSFDVVLAASARLIRTCAVIYSANRREWMTNLKVTRFWRTKNGAVTALRKEV